MLFISHRGNINGPDKNLENNPDHIIDLLTDSISVEIDIWKIDDSFHIGHDHPTVRVDLDFLRHPKLWIHAKNLDALHSMLNEDMRCFWHQNDDFTITSDGYIWTFPDRNVTTRSIIVDLNDNWREKNYNAYGVCSDFHC